jgi:hypothetical protein
MADVGLYRHLGFVEVMRSPSDEQVRPYPLLHLRRERSGRR